MFFLVLSRVILIKSKSIKITLDKTGTIILVTSLMAQTVKNLPAMQETRVQSLGQEDPLEKGKATDSSIIAWKIPWTEEPGGLLDMGSQRVRHNRSTFTFFAFILY